MGTVRKYHSDWQHDLMKPRNELKAPPGLYRVIGVDTFEGPTADYLIGDFASLQKAEKAAQDEGGEMNPCYVYDDKGKMAFEAGQDAAAHLFE